jgi:hypothetical protein
MFANTFFPNLNNIKRIIKFLIIFGIVATKSYSWNFIFIFWGLDFGPKMNFKKKCKHKFLNICVNINFSAINEVN